MCYLTKMKDQDSAPQNLTLALPKSLIKKAKIFAITENKSLSLLVKEILEGLVGGKGAYESAMTRQKAKMGSVNLGLKGEISWTRDDLYE